ncbi:MAG: HEAT repeat domain-containing protein [Ignavibacteriaceae bacterium]
MKSLLFALILTFTMVSTPFPAGNPKAILEMKQNTVSSLLIGLNSSNLGLKSSSAYMLGELKVTSAVIPLMRILHENKNEDLRIAAALALYKIGTPLAINAVKQSVRFDNSERVNKLCASFYNEYQRNKHVDEEKYQYVVNLEEK